MVEDNLSRLEVSNGRISLNTEYLEGTQICIEPFGDVSFEVFENDEYLALVHATDIADLARGIREQE